ncbi:MAG: DUF421 domain-containing protein [Oscillospiraceae bacterium]|jgi:uncharacterized membrane protein YcaP (DUF421 family)|nr:DUF421 domain-containing protein [Oscillospiraceae bacterium]
MAIIIIRTLIMFIALFAAMRFMGKRQLGQLEPSELVVAILIADLASHPLADVGIPLMNGLIPVLVLLCGEVLISGIAVRSHKFSNLIWGEPNVLIFDGRLNKRELWRNRLSQSEVMEALRKKDVFELSTVSCAILENDGTITVKAKAPEGG